jgi:oligoendopeptidase F
VPGRRCIAGRYRSAGALWRDGLSWAAMAATAPAQPTDPELQATAWDLEPLVDGEGQDGVEHRLRDALARAQAFSQRYAGKLGELDSAGLAEAMGELAIIHELVGRAGYYAALGFSTDTADPANGALLQKVQEQETAIQTTLLFFELEWAALPDTRAAATSCATCVATASTC